MASDGSTVPQSEATIVSVIIVVLDVNDNSPVWTSVFNPVTLIEVGHYCSMLAGK